MQGTRCCLVKATKRQARNDINWERTFICHAKVSQRVGSPQYAMYSKERSGICVLEPVGESATWGLAPLPGKCPSRDLRVCLVWPQQNGWEIRIIWGVRPKLGLKG
jgi:hypothetical protein